MVFIVGFAVWIGFALAAAFLVRLLVRAPATVAWLTYVLAFFGAFIGGMLGNMYNVHHEPTPLRVTGLLGAAIGAAGFAAIYHAAARKLV